MEFMSRLFSLNRTDISHLWTLSLHPSHLCILWAVCAPANAHTVPVLWAVLIIPTTTTMMTTTIINANTRWNIIVTLICKYERSVAVAPHWSGVQLKITAPCFTSDHAPANSPAVMHFMQIISDKLIFYFYCSYQQFYAYHEQQEG